MKSKISYFFLNFVALGLMSSCSSIYLPNVPATPMLQQRGEGYVSAHINPHGHASGTIALAATDHVAVLANGSFLDQGKSGNANDKQWLVEGGLGYFTKVGDKKDRILEIYAGYGRGNTRQINQRAWTQGYDVSEIREMDFDKQFVQVNYSSKKREKINMFGRKWPLNFGTAIRLSRVGMRSFIIDDEAAALEENIFVEPVFFTRLGLTKGLQLQYTSGLNIGLMKNNYLKAGNSVLTLGVAYNF